MPFSFGFADEDGYWAFLREAAGAIAMLLERLDQAELEIVRAEVAMRIGTVPRGRREI